MGRLENKGIKVWKNVKNKKRRQKTKAGLKEKGNQQIKRRFKKERGGKEQNECR